MKPRSRIGAAVTRLVALLWTDRFVVPAVYGLAGGLTYLAFLPGLGYFTDAWYLMYAAGARGPLVFIDIFSIDRPLAAGVMVPAYWLFGSDPALYGLAAFALRLLSAWGLSWTAGLVWPGRRSFAAAIGLLFLLFPGFLSQLNGIVYLPFLASLAAAMLSLGLTVKVLQSSWSSTRLLSFLASGALLLLYLGIVEFFVGVEVVRLCLIVIIAFRGGGSLPGKVFGALRAWFPWFVPLAAYLTWRVFLFQSERGATDVSMHFRLGDILSNPLQFIAIWATTLWNDSIDVMLRAWFSPLSRLAPALDPGDWFVAFVLAVVLAAAAAHALSRLQADPLSEAGQRSRWRREAALLGMAMLLFGLLPIILVERSVDFVSFDRYSLLASAGAAVLWAVALNGLPPSRLRGAALGLLVVLASLTHTSNGLARLQETRAANDFWWQISWRVPQLDVGTTLIAHYPVAAEEDYFVWGPANLIYYPESTHASYVQPGIYAALLNQDTIAKVLAREPQEFSNRRGIRTYPNYRNILVLSKPTPASCVQVIDSERLELSSAEDGRVVSIASYSEGHHIDLTAPFRHPPAIPFGEEPTHGWCFLYERASFFRQAGEWEQVTRLGDEALTAGLAAGDAIEWLPFLQAYAVLGRGDRVTQVGQYLAGDAPARDQACQMLLGLPETDALNQAAVAAFCD